MVIFGDCLRVHCRVLVSLYLFTKYGHDQCSKNRPKRVGLVQLLLEEFLIIIIKKNKNRKLWLTILLVIVLYKREQLNCTFLVTKSVFDFEVSYKS